MKFLPEQLSSFGALDVLNFSSTVNFPYNLLRKMLNSISSLYRENMFEYALKMSSGVDLSLGVLGHSRIYSDHPIDSMQLCTLPFFQIILTIFKVRLYKLAYNFSFRSSSSSSSSFALVRSDTFNLKKLGNHNHKLTGNLHIQLILLNMEPIWFVISCDEIIVV